MERSRFSTEVGHIIILMVLTLWTSLWMFPRVTPDSQYYLVLVKIIKGRLPIHMAVPPYCYRLLMPLIVALFPTYELYTWAWLSVIMNMMLVPVVYQLIREFDIGRAGAFVGTGLTTVGVMSIIWGSWVGTDLPAILCMALAFGLMIRGPEHRGDIRHHSAILGLLVTGTLFKEFVMLGAAAWFLHSLMERDGDGVVFSFFTAMLSIVSYFAVRTSWAEYGISASFMWQWNDLWNFVNNMDKVIETFVLGFMFFIPAIVIALIVGRGVPQFRRAALWFIATLPLSAYLFMGLFMAYFDLRFVWPMYLGMAPMAGIAGDWLWEVVNGFWTQKIEEQVESIHRMGRLR